MSPRDEQSGAAMDAALRAEKAPKRKRGGNQRTGPSQAALKLLGRINAGEALTATRTFPGPWRYRVGIISLGAAGTASAASVLALINFGLIAPKDAAPLEDFLLYEITDAGSKTLTQADPSHDPAQLDWTEQSR